ncbi:hypothetical protein [Nostoc sp.]|uniref:hypothetical protein n=1 Tax=Nostoc sp. TaxID=1180 RepID=UPI002FF6AABE
MPQALPCANSSRLLWETLPRTLLNRKSLVDEVFPTCVYTVARYWEKGLGDEGFSVHTELQFSTWTRFIYTVLLTLELRSSTSKPTKPQTPNSSLSTQQF